MNNKVMKNPLLPGAYPDPSICRVGDDFYMVCSSFELYPGIPVFHSRDLVNWEQIGYALDKRNDFHVEANLLANGVMAPTIRYHDGVYYIINCNFCDDGNFIITAKNPAGPWSKPHWLTDVPGIDASLFFNDDGKAYIIGIGEVVKRADGSVERGIWAAEYDVHHFKMIGEPTAIWDSALRGAASPEAPHLYKVGEYYYLVIAEGGTEHYHAVTVARSRELFGWYEGNPANPVMTHRQFGFTYPIANVGHADLVDTPSGNWYAVLLASRIIGGVHKNLGRETYICPVVWERGWPVFSPESGKIDWEYPADGTLPWTEYEREPERDEFEDSGLAFCWNFWGTPYEEFWRLSDSNLYIKCLPRKMAEEIKPLFMENKKVYDSYASFICRRQCHIDFDISSSMMFMPEGAETAGLMMMQASNHQYRVERAAIDKDGNPAQVLRVIQATSEFDRPPYMPGFTSTTEEKVLTEVSWDQRTVVLHVKVRGQDIDFYYGADEASEQLLIAGVDGRVINPEKVGGMMGTVIGMFASSNHTESRNEAAFDWFWYKALDA